MGEETKPHEWPRTEKDGEAMALEIIKEGAFEDNDDIRTMLCTTILHFPGDRDRPPNSYFITKLTKTMANKVFFDMGVGCDRRRDAEAALTKKEKDKMMGLTLVQGEANASDGAEPLQGA